MWLKNLETCLLDTWKTRFISGTLLKTRTVVNVRVFSWLEMSSHTHVSDDCFVSLMRSDCRVMCKNLAVMHEDFDNVL